METKLLHNQESLDDLEEPEPSEELEFDLGLENATRHANQDAEDDGEQHEEDGEEHCNEKNKGLSVAI